MLIKTYEGAPFQYISIKRRGHSEAVLRYIGCNLSCKFCFAHSIIKLPKKIERSKTCSFTPDHLAEKLRRFVEGRQISHVRITGGEPLLSPERTHHLVEFLEKYDELVRNDHNLLNKIVIQTNGLSLAQAEVQELICELSDSCPNLKIMLELSLKGTNEEEYELLTNHPRSGFMDQIYAHNFLRGLAEKRDNIIYKCRMGIGPHKKSIVFIYPDTFPSHEDSLSEVMFHPTRWSAEFREIYEYEVNKQGYMAMEYIYVYEGSLNARTQCYTPSLIRLLKSKLILDRSNRVNEYSIFRKKAGNLRFPLLSSKQVSHLEMRCEEIFKKFRYRPDEVYEREFLREA